jgi:methionyl-tRNA formyltransferase
MKSTDPAGSARQISAVFMLDISAYTGPLLAGWVEAGHHIGAIVVPGFRRQPKGFSIGNFRRRLKRRRLLRRYLGNARVKLIEFGRPYDWDALGRQLSKATADVLISYAFPTLIPQDMLGSFPKGGLNLHPALLPNYRGPHPIHRLAVDGQHAVHGGVTLHRMSAGFDDGDILGQVPFSEADWTSKQILVDSAATAMRMLVSDAVPAYCKGILPGAPQPTGDFVWARLEPAHMMISQAMSIGHVARLWQVLGLLPGIYIEIAGRKVRLGFQIRRLGSPTGQAPVRRWGTVEFDLADGRVLHLTYSRLLKRLVNAKRAFARAPAGKTPPEMRLFGKVGAADDRHR